MNFGPPGPRCPRPSQQRHAGRVADAARKPAQLHEPPPGRPWSTPCAKSGQQNGRTPRRGSTGRPSAWMPTRPRISSSKNAL